MPHATLCPELSAADVDLFVEMFLARWDNPNTRKAYRADVDTWRRWCHDRGRHPISGVTRTHVEVYARWLTEERHNSRSTVNHRIGTLKQFFELAIDDDLVTKNPCRLVRRPKARPDASRRNHLTVPEFVHIMDAAQKASPTDHALLMIMGYLGIRVSEACSLNIEDCQVLEKAHRCIRWIGKGDKPRLAPMPPVVQLAVDAAIGDRTSGPLLLRRDGTRMTRRSADRVVKRCAKAAGIDIVVHPHMLRASFIVLSINAGEDIRNVQLSAGHANISTTVDTYDRCRVVLDSHSAYRLAGYLAQAS